MHATGSERNQTQEPTVLVQSVLQSCLISTSVTWARNQTQNNAVLVQSVPFLVQRGLQSARIHLASALFLSARSTPESSSSACPLPPIAARLPP